MKNETTSAISFLRSDVYAEALQANQVVFELRTTLMALRHTESQLDNEIALLTARHQSRIESEVTEEGKLVYPNEGARKTALTLALADDNSYKNLLSAKRETAALIAENNLLVERGMIDIKIKRDFLRGGAEE